MGENCTCGSRIIVDASIQDDVVHALAGATASWTVGDPLDRSTRLGPLIEPSALERVLGYIEQAQATGANVVHGGRRVLESSGGRVVEPTILDDVKPDMPVVREEISGPVVSVVAFDDESEAVTIANDSTYGLAASVFTHDLDRAHRLARQLRAGTVAVNCYGEGDVTTPFGRLQAVRIRRPRQGHRGIRPVHRGQDHLDSSSEPALRLRTRRFARS
jgi:gamma-glutamyl-gamma-aminobutyraldehyde dehydrogenase